MKLLVATQNKNKVKELKELLVDLPIELVTLADLDDNYEVIEDGKTFEENALLKAKYFANKYQMVCLADDSGLVIEALNGEPGLYSARYANGTDYDNSVKVLNKMKNNKNRKAYFICVLVLYYPNGKSYTYEGRAYGLITRSPKGTNGFGYDPIFYTKEFNLTFAELSSVQKNSISHRSYALRLLKESFYETINN